MAPKRTGGKLLRYDRNLGVRLVAGADEAGRGPLAGPLVVAGVLLDYASLRDHRVRPLARLNDSKQVDEATRDELYRAVLACAERVSVHVFPPGVIDRDGLHKSNLRGLREALWACQPADISLVDGFQRQIDWPENNFLHAPLPGAGRDAIILLGVEPNLRWRTFGEHVSGLATSFGVEESTMLALERA